MPFRIKTAQDIFQYILDEILKDIPNVAGTADDILAFGSTDIEFDQSSLLKACRLNSGKLQFKQEKINFYVHILTEKGSQPSEDKLQTILKLQKMQSSYLLFKG